MRLRTATRILIFTGILVIGPLIVVLLLSSYWNSELDVDSITTFQISPGGTPRSIALSLDQLGIAKFPRVFQLLVRITRYDRRLIAGIYEIVPGTTVRDFVAGVSSGRSIPTDIVVRIDEGATMTDVAQSLNEAGVTRSEITPDMIVMEDSYTSYWFLDTLSSGEGLDGYLFPDTYAFSRNSEITDIISRILDNAEKKFIEIGIDSIEYESPDGLSIRQILTLASIVQKESVIGEMSTVAGVFLNRLRDGWRLESDATVNFILGTSKLLPSASDIHVTSPYNTYLHKGLPPGPIGNPGFEAIQSVLNSEEHDYYFFLHTPEAKTVLSKTFEDHLAARAKYWE